MNILSDGAGIAEKPFVICSSISRTGGVVSTTKMEAGGLTVNASKR